MHPILAFLSSAITSLLAFLLLVLTYITIKPLIWLVRTLNPRQGRDERLQFMMLVFGLGIWCWFIDTIFHKWLKNWEGLEIGKPPEKAPVKVVVQAWQGIGTVGEGRRIVDDDLGDKMWTAD